MAYNLMLGSAPMVALNITLIAINCWYLFVVARTARAKTANATALSEESDRHARR